MSWRRNCAIEGDDGLDVVVIMIALSFACGPTFASPSLLSGSKCYLRPVLLCQLIQVEFYSIGRVKLEGKESSWIS